ncbi:hypothetical protein TWF718_005764 [Orbilia javanica]|uniref:3CxxC-type domain-containing protein n=1 Tax=Orbilia javanica TaxID=47235 RepID=A0AAN8MSE2_9PEZI
MDGPPYSSSAFSQNKSEDITSTSTTESDEIESFQKELQNMDKYTLNHLEIAIYTRTQRRLIHEERCQRSVARKAAKLVNNQAQVLEPKPDAIRTLKDPPKHWYHFPEYHDLIDSKVTGVLFEDTDNNGTLEWQTNLAGTFKCSKGGCNHEWESWIIFTIIRQYELANGNIGYNAKVFNQRCIKCKSLGIMTLDRDTYAERVIRRLKVWKGEKVEAIEVSSKRTLPHIERLCEGCKAGRCRAGDWKS